MKIKLTKKEIKKLKQNTALKNKVPSHFHLELRVAKKKVKIKGKRKRQTRYYDRFTGKQISKKKANHLYGMTKYWNKVRTIKRVNVKNSMIDKEDYSTAKNYPTSEMRNIYTEIKQFRKELKQSGKNNKEIYIKIGQKYFGSP
tara:strand:+ start:917 stop:1345 length:429 start_codon:yes stop_codon:yes gene_type:complete